MFNLYKSWLEKRWKGGKLIISDTSYDEKGAKEAKNNRKNQKKRVRQGEITEKERKADANKSLYKSWLALRKDSITGEQSKEGKPSGERGACDICGKPGGHSDEDFVLAERTSRGKRTGRRVHGAAEDTFDDLQYDDNPESPWYKHIPEEMFGGDPGR